MNRRCFLGVLPVVSIGCGGRNLEEEQMRSFDDGGGYGLGGGIGQPPWHMWGSTERYNVTIPAGDSGNDNASVQLARIEYKRPETWSFFLAGRVVAGDAPLATITIRLDFDIILGVGRSAFQTRARGSQAFQTFRWDLSPGLGVQSLGPKWCTEARTPPTDDSDPNSTTIVSSFPSETISVESRLFASVGAPQAADLNYVIEASSYFAPRTHIRPDWYLEDAIDVERMKGEETGGR